MKAKPAPRTAPAKKSARARKPALAAAAPTPAARRGSPPKLKSELVIEPTRKVPTSQSPIPVPPHSNSKQATLISLLRSDVGTTIADMMAATGWQAHTVRGTISGVLRKKLGLTVTAVPTEGDRARRYRIVDGASA